MHLWVVSPGCSTGSKLPLSTAASAKRVVSAGTKSVSRVNAMLQKTSKAVKVWRGCPYDAHLMMICTTFPWHATIQASVHLDTHDL